MDEGREEVITKSNTEIIGEDIVNEHCYVNKNSKEVFYYHLGDHNYILKRKPEKTAKKAQTQKRKIKITELRAVYNCRSCGYRTLNQEIFSQHSCSQKQRPAKYIDCTRRDKSKAPEGYEKCTKCTYFTKNKSSLKVHMRIHAKGTPYKCTECEFSAKDLKDLITHYKETKDLLKCDCGYTTHVKQQMSAHKRYHMVVKPFSCGVCGFSTVDRTSLQRHWKKHE